MDIIDHADEVMEQMQTARIEAIRTTKARLPSIGRCHYCSSATEENQLFCDADCRDDYEHEQKAKQRNGRT